MRKVDLIVDLQYGSTGKGLLAGYMAVNNGYDTVVNANMPNAGHTFIDSRGNKMIHKVLPNGIVSRNLERVLIGPGSVFNINTLYREIKESMAYGYLKNVTIFIHENAVPLQAKHTRMELENLNLTSIGSTSQGSAAAMISRINRSTTDKTIARDLRDEIEGAGLDIIVVNSHQYGNLLQDSTYVLAEAAQGYSLGISEKFYPFCTSRDCVPARFLADMAIPIGYLACITGTARTYPIRVGGTSGDWYLDQEETTWQDLGLEDEFTTVTKRKRRVATYSRTQIEEAVRACSIDQVFLNFCNHAEHDDYLDEIRDHIRHLTDLKYEGWGPTVYDVKMVK